MSLKSRNIGLDVVRSIAILMVLVCHILMWTSTLYKELSGDFVLDFMMLSRLGWVGVEIFFVLSGFLIGKIFIEEFVTNFNGSSRATLAKFYSRRWFRTLPMYYLLLVINILLLVNTFPESDINSFLHESAGYFLFLQNFLGRAELAGVALMAVSWSLVLEEWFYLIFPVFIILLRKSSKNFSRENFFRFLILFIIVITILRAIYIYFTSLSVGSTASLVFLRLDTFAIGILFAYMHSFLPDFYGFLAKKRFFLLSIVLITASYFMALYFNGNFYIKTGLFTILPFSIAVFIAFLEKNVTRGSKIAENTSKISYSLYLIHVPPLANFLVPYTYILYDNTIKLPVFATFAIFFAAVYVVAVLFYRHYEKPMMNLRDAKFVKNFVQKLG